jgi:hypothetical protein
VATAHVLFKIVIPQVLSMDFAEPAPHRMLLSTGGHRSIDSKPVSRAARSVRTRHELHGFHALNIESACGALKLRKMAIRSR